jgi:hypothetical protein
MKIDTESVKYFCYVQFACASPIVSAADHSLILSHRPKESREKGMAEKDTKKLSRHYFSNAIFPYNFRKF